MSRRLHLVRLQGAVSSVLPVIGLAEGTKGDVGRARSHKFHQDVQAILCSCTAMLPWNGVWPPHASSLHADVGEVPLRQSEGMDNTADLKA
jgi:hypothetical protein